jgi:hypothetical protein
VRPSPGRLCGPAIELVHVGPCQERGHQRVHRSCSFPPAGTDRRLCGSRALVASRIRALRLSGLPLQNSGPDPSLSNTRVCATPRTSTGAGPSRRRARRSRSSRAPATARRLGVRGRRSMAKARAAAGCAEGSAPGRAGRDPPEPASAAAERRSPLETPLPPGRDPASGTASEPRRRSRTRIVGPPPSSAWTAKALPSTVASIGLASFSFAVINQRSPYTGYANPSSENTGYNRTR